MKTTRTRRPATVYHDLRDRTLAAIPLSMAASHGLGGFAGSTPTDYGYVRLPDVPGLGFEEKAVLYAVMR